MKTAVFALSAAVLAFSFAAPANAAPAAVGHATAQTEGFTQVQYKKKNYRKGYKQGYRKGVRRGYRAGHRYDHAPRGWRRYSSRPSFWQTRGCVVVGPVWFCP